MIESGVSAGMVNARNRGTISAWGPGFAARGAGLAAGDEAAADGGAVDRGSAGGTSAGDAAGSGCAGSGCDAAGAAAAGWLAGAGGWLAAGFSCGDCVEHATRPHTSHKNTINRLAIGELLNEL
jgi:hypothetical protein